MFGGSEININFPTEHPGPPDLPDRVRGRRRQARRSATTSTAATQRLLAILKGSDRKMADIAIDRPKGIFVGAGADAARHLRRRRRRQRLLVLRAAVRRHAGAGAQAARPRRRQRPAQSRRADATGSGIFDTRPQPIAAAEFVFRAQLRAPRHEELPHGYRPAGRGGRGHGRLQPLRKGAGDQRRRRAGRHVPRRSAHHPLRRHRNSLRP